jgi:hypothetical protein
VDHILLGASDLERAVTEFERVTGVRPLYGGKHPFGTHNALVSLGKNLYLELIAPRPGAIPESFFNQLATLENLTPIAWAASTPAPQQARQRLESEGFQISDVRAGSRIRPDGTTLQWQTFELQRKLPGAPFFISWAPGSAHPSATSPTGCKLESFTIATPEREVLNRLLSFSKSPYKCIAHKPSNLWSRSTVQREKWSSNRHCTPAYRSLSSHRWF